MQSLPLSTELNHSITKRVWYLQVLPSDVGQRQPLYFFLLPAYWKPTQAIKAGASAEEAPDSPLMGSTGADSEFASKPKAHSHACAVSCMRNTGGCGKEAACEHLLT